MRRLRPGDALTVGDGRGAHRAARFGPALEPAGDVEHVARPAPVLTVAFALTKADRPELAIQKLTEIGIDVIVPFVADRSIVRWDEAKAARNVTRWRVIAREAAAQAHRPWLPEIADVTTFDALATRPGAALAHPDGVPVSLRWPLVLVGPEGGWSKAEETAIRPRVALGAHVLRAETAALVAGAFLAALRGDSGGPFVQFSGPDTVGGCA